MESGRGSSSERALVRNAGQQLDFPRDPQQLMQRFLALERTVGIHDTGLNDCKRKIKQLEDKLRQEKQDELKRFVAEVQQEAEGKLKAKCASLEDNEFPDRNVVPVLLFMLISTFGPIVSMHPACRALFSLFGGGSAFMWRRWVIGGCRAREADVSSFSLEVMPSLLATLGEEARLALSTVEVDALDACVEGQKAKLLLAITQEEKACRKRITPPIGSCLHSTDWRRRPLFYEPDETDATW